MMQSVESSHTLDRAGMPYGGRTTGVGIEIEWQRGPLGAPGSPDRKGPNGAFVEGVIAAAMDRIRWYQEVCDGRFHCEENAFALLNLESALVWLNRRTAKRTERGVEGTHTP